MLVAFVFSALVLVGRSAPPERSPVPVGVAVDPSAILDHDKLRWMEARLIELQARLDQIEEAP